MSTIKHESIGVIREYPDYEGILMISKQKKAFVSYQNMPNLRNVILIMMNN